MPDVSPEMVDPLDCGNWRDSFPCQTCDAKTPSECPRYEQDNAALAAMPSEPVGCDKRTFRKNYLVYDDGRIWSLNVHRFLRPTVTRGYARVTLSIDGETKGFLVHRIVCEAFHGAPPDTKSEARHLNGVSTDNRASNLAWGSRSENAKDSVVHGTCSGPNNGKAAALKMAGENSSNVRLTWEDIDQIRCMHAEGMSYGEIASKFGVHRTNIYKICRGKSWKDEHRPVYTSPNTSHGLREVVSWLRNMPTDDRQAFNREVAGLFGHKSKVPGGTKAIVDCVLPYLANAIERLTTLSTTPEPGVVDATIAAELAAISPMKPFATTPQDHIPDAGKMVTPAPNTQDAGLVELLEAIEQLPVEEMIHQEPDGSPTLLGYCMQAQGEWDRVTRAVVALKAQEGQGHG